MTDANTVTVTDQAGKVRRSVTNALGQLVRVDEPTSSGLGTISSANQPTYYTYDVLNNLTTVDQGVQTRNFAYNSLSRLVSAHNPESGTINYVYDANGNLTSKTDARSIMTTYTYDALNRVVTRTYSDSTPAVGYFYDNLTNGKGKLIKVQNSVSTTEYTAFDILGRVTAAKQTTDGGDAAGYATGYTYNLSGALIEETYPSGRKVKNVLDNDGELSLVQSARCGVVNGVTATCSDPQGYFSYAKSFTYNAAGAVTSMQLGNGRWETTQFNSRLQPTMIGLGSGPTSQNLLKLDYTYGTTANNGNVLTQTITVPTVGSNNGFTAVQTYNYDELNRLKDATENVTPTGGTAAQSWKQTFTFDRYGNRRFDEANTTMPSSFANEAVTNPTISTSNNRLTSPGYAYDASGNTTADAGGQSYTYDAENKMISASNSSGTIGEYFYDGDGKRVKKVVPSTGEVTVFVYDAAGKLIGEYSTVLASTNEAKVNYLTSDHLGSPRINTDQNGAVIARHDYHPFGEEIFTAQRTAELDYSADSVRKQFTGYERDTETDLDFAQARMYDNNTGRFTSVDPQYFQASMTLDPQRFHLYGYARNNPLKWTDPNGERLFLGGDSKWLLNEGLYIIAGGEESFNAFFHIVDGEVLLNAGIDAHELGNANPGIQLLAEAVMAQEIYLIAAEDSFKSAAAYFTGRNGLNKQGERIVRALNGDDKFGVKNEFQRSYLVGTEGRHLALSPAQLANGDIVFAVVVLNNNGSGLKQKGPSGYADADTEKAQAAGLGQKVEPVSFIIHELAENLGFASMRRSGQPLDIPAYLKAHSDAEVREVKIRTALKISGGFGGARMTSLKED